MTAFDINDYQQKANNGDAEAQYQLGLCYAKGLGVEKNFRESARYWLQASKQQHAQALVGLGKLFEKGVGVPQDYTKAYQCYHAATAQNLAEAKVRLAMLYMQGFGVEQDPKKAVQLFIQAAEQGDATAQYNLAVAYEKGLGGFVQNPEQATFWYQQSADLGYAPAVNRLAENLDKQTDNQASNVDAEAIFVNATQKIKNQLHDAMTDFQHSAEHGFAKAQYNVGIAHLFGVGGVAQNTDLAVEFLQNLPNRTFVQPILCWGGIIKAVLTLPIFNKRSTLTTLKPFIITKKQVSWAMHKPNIFWQKCMKQATAWTKMMKPLYHGYVNRQNKAMA